MKDNESRFHSGTSPGLAGTAIKHLSSEPLCAARLLDHVQAAVIAIDLQGVVTYWNHHAETLYGWSRDEALGRNAGDLLVIPSDEELAHRIMSELLAKGSWEGEFMVRRKDGTTFPAHVVNTLLREDGASSDAPPNGFVGVSVDISERIRLEEEREKLIAWERAARAQAEQAQRRVTHILESITDGFYTLDGDWRFTYVNAQAAGILERKPADLLGKNIWEEFPGLIGTDSDTEYHKAAEMQSVGVFEDCYAPLDKCVEVRVYPARQDGLAVYFTDISERKKAEQAASFLASIVESSDAAVIGTTLDGTVLSWNAGAEELYGYTTYEVIGRSIAIVVPPEDRSEMKENLNRIAAGESLERHENVGVRKDGTRVDVLLSVSPIKDNAGRVMGVSTIARDITERKAYQARLEEDAAAQMRLLQQLMTAQEVERRRLSMEIHDGPLQSIGVALMGLDRARRRRERGEDELADRELTNLRATLGGTVAELRATLADLSQEVLVSNGLRAALESHVQRYAELTGRNIELRYEAPGKLPGDLELLFYRLAQESLTNIRKHSHADNVDIVLALDEHNRLRMTISDDGLGFDVETVLNRHTDGKHLGLRSMWERVRAVGGDLTIVSTPGNGTTLQFVCPLPAWERAPTRLTEQALIEQALSQRVS